MKAIFFLNQVQLLRNLSALYFIPKQAYSWTWFKKKMVFVIILHSINLHLHYFQNKILWVFFWKLSTFFGCWENERKFEENQMKCEKGTNLFVWFKTQVFALSSLCKGGFWLRFLRKKAHTHTHTHTHT